MVEYTFDFGRGWTNGLDLFQERPNLHEALTTFAMKKALLLLTLVSYSAYGQRDVDLSSSQLNANLLPLTISFEGKLGDNQSFTLAGGLGYAVHYSSSNFSEAETSFVAIPIAYSSFRNYYQRKRVKKNNLRPNSGNYYGLFALYQFEPLGDPSNLTEAVAHFETRNVYAIGPVWGIQRNYASGVHLGLSLGFGVIGGENIQTGVSGIGEFELGFVLFNK